jgi:hypothetical protein
MEQNNTKIEPQYSIVGFWFFCFFETGSPYVAQAGLKFMILLPQPPECWDYRCVAPHPFSQLIYSKGGDIIQ